MAVARLVAEETLGLVRAREELGLDPAEFDLAVRLGEVRTVPGGSASRRVPCAEAERLRGETGFPRTLRDRLRLVGTTSGAALIGVSPGRFTRLARCGVFHPVRWHVNQYRAVVWLYLASEVGRHAQQCPELLTGWFPADLRALLALGEDRRAANWRQRRVDQLLRDAGDAWESAAVWAALLGPDGLEHVVTDRDERAYLRRLLPALPTGRLGAYAVRSTVEALRTADSPDERSFARYALIHALDEARTGRPAPGVPPRRRQPRIRSRRALVAPPGRER